MHAMAKNNHDPQARWSGSDMLPENPASNDSHTCGVPYSEHGSGFFRVKTRMFELARVAKLGSARFFSEVLGFCLLEFDLNNLSIW